MSGREDELTENLRTTLANDRLTETDTGSNEGRSNAFLTAGVIVVAFALPILSAIFFWGSIATIFSNFQRGFANGDNYYEIIIHDASPQELNSERNLFYSILAESNDFLVINFFSMHNEYFSQWSQSVSVYSPDLGPVLKIDEAWPGYSPLMFPVSDDFLINEIGAELMVDGISEVWFKDDLGIARRSSASNNDEIRINWMPYRMVAILDISKYDALFSRYSYAYDSIVIAKAVEAIRDYLHGVGYKGPAFELPNPSKLEVSEIYRW